MSTDRPTEIDAFSQLDLAVRARTRTHVPGIVTAYDPVTKRAAVQPARQQLTPAGAPVLLPIAQACPVIWPRFAGIVFVGRLNPGDTVLLAVSDRELEPFLAAPSGQPHTPTSTRTHSLTDAICVVGLSQDSKPINPAIPPTVCHIGREDLKAFMQIGIDAPTSTLEGQPIRLGRLATHAALLGAPLGFGGAMVAWTTTVNTAALTWQSSLKDPAATVVFLDAIAAATVTLFATIATWHSTKVLIE